ncbi:hypothetical protein A5482_012380 [Cyanobacterium sp. IPPAS B-1200]|uniref:hypothetical protein n=1 Tax=Cyanobacterium sp. IPPAS B-1200 TaxID=1562720 RepID=UPI00114CE132|nr:hypothetical protein [Cyanobacterium sp. IPPAS B-1200]
MPSAFVELALLTQTQERIAVTQQQAVESAGLEVPDEILITANFNTDTMTVSIGALPIESSVSGGDILIEAVDYLAPLEAAAIPGIDATLDVTGADLTSTSKVKALLELAQLIQEDEEIAELNQLTINYNIDAGTASINATFGGIPQVNAAGRQEFVVNNYLA